MEDFNACINKCGIVDARAVEGTMSWCNGQEGQNRKWAKLDIALVNGPISKPFSIHFHGVLNAKNI